VKNESKIETDIEAQRRAIQQEILVDTAWISSEELHKSLTDRKLEKFSINDWKRSGRIFSIFHHGNEYFAKYQFDASYQPLPIIKLALDALGVNNDSWLIAAWFHFPNGWITTEESDGLVAARPKDALNQCADIIQAAHRRKATYVA
jgi:hypothetical protein